MRKMEEQVSKVAVLMENPNPVDELGLLMAEIAPKVKRIEELKAGLKAGSKETVEGLMYKATLVTQMRETLDAEKVHRFLHPNQLREALRVTPVISVKVTAISK